uniref:Secreted protein n=1 Tax=Anguilla anguilla TaxID=7936 RepID=A0A0E9TN15_ANGAN
MVIFGSWTVPGWYGLVLLFDILSHFELARSVEKLEMCVLTTRSNPLSAFLRMVRKNRVPAYKPTPADCNSICVWS